MFCIFAPTLYFLMKKNIFISFLILSLSALISCESDDLCDHNVNTPRLVVRFYNQNNTRTPFSVANLTVSFGEQHYFRFTCFAFALGISYHLSVSNSGFGHNHQHSNSYTHLYSRTNIRKQGLRGKNYLQHSFGYYSRCKQLLAERSEHQEHYRR